MRIRNALALSIAVLLLGALPYAAAHGRDEMDMGDGAVVVDENPKHQMPSYFRHPHYQAWNSAHAILMILAWVMAMPLAIFLSVARSRYHLPAQAVFNVVNGLGVFCGFVYNHSTPDLYVNNSHHPLGWVVTAFTIAWTIMSVCVAYSEHRRSRRASLEQSKALNAPDMAPYDPSHQYDHDFPRDSRDSGQGTARNSDSFCGSRQNSSDQIYLKPEDPEDSGFEEDEEHDHEPEKEGFLGNNRVDRFLSNSMGKASSQRLYTALRVSQIVLEKFLLLLGFTAVATGFVVSGGVYRDRQVFSGLAHYIKGGIFIWYGLLTLGRWMGAFTEFGWAWNVRPQRPLVSRWKTMIPSAEFTESFVIWLYGASNVFLEHMNDASKEWSPSDLEHLSITVLFFGGGLLGMLLESPWMRDLTNTTVADQKSKKNDLPTQTHFRALPSAEASEIQRWEEPETYRVPLNPMPALTIMLLGMMMSAHHQDSMVSTMMHAQWGGLLSAFAVARLVTYVTLYLKPPTSHFPARPPSEIVAAFCLTSGGLMFMNSSSDVVWAIESNGLDAMSVFTTSLGITGLVLAWEVIVFAIKGWAVRRERSAAGTPLA